MTPFILALYLATAPTEFRVQHIPLGEDVTLRDGRRGRFYDFEAYKGLIAVDLKLQAAEKILIDRMEAEHQLYGVINLKDNNIQSLQKDIAILKGSAETLMKQWDECEEALATQSSSTLWWQATTGVLGVASLALGVVLLVGG